MSAVQGSCLCGEVRFEAALKEQHFHVCHCSICRRQGGPQMATQAQGTPDFAADGGLRWYKSSDIGERGFCGTCGTNLFWRMIEKPDEVFMISIGALNDADLSLASHIYIDTKPEYYDFKDECPRLTEAEFLAMMEAS